MRNIGEESALLTSTPALIGGITAGGIQVFCDALMPVIIGKIRGVKLPDQSGVQVGIVVVCSFFEESRVCCTRSCRGS